MNDSNADRPEEYLFAVKKIELWEVASRVVLKDKEVRGMFLLWQCSRKCRHRHVDKFTHAYAC